jgi:hypothetical protein
MAQAITTTEVQRAALELASMRSSLSSWLRYRHLNDQVMAGRVQTRRPLAYAQRVVASNRDMTVEQDLANKLHALLEVVMRGRQLPNADLRTNPQGAVQLARIAIDGGAQVASPTATGGLFSGAHPWLWPALIVGGLLLTVTTAIKTAADVAKDREEKACIQAGACTDYGFWLKAGGLAALAWFAWHQMGGRELVHSLTKGRRS